MLCCQCMAISKFAFGVFWNVSQSFELQLVESMNGGKKGKLQLHSNHFTNLLWSGIMECILVEGQRQLTISGRL